MVSLLMSCMTIHLYLPRQSVVSPLSSDVRVDEIDPSVLSGWRLTSFYTF